MNYDALNLALERLSDLVKKKLEDDDRLPSSLSVGTHLPYKADVTKCKFFMKPLIILLWNTSIFTANKILTFFFSLQMTVTDAYNKTFFIPVHLHKNFPQAES